VIKHEGRSESDRAPRDDSSVRATVVLPVVLPVVVLVVLVVLVVVVFVGSRHRRMGP
jgi:hypothetical protein